MIAKKLLDWSGSHSKDRRSTALGGFPAGARRFAVLAKHGSPWEISFAGTFLGRSSEAAFHAFEIGGSLEGALEISFEKAQDELRCEVYALLEGELLDGFSKLSPCSFLPLEVDYSVAVNDESGEALLTPVLHMLSFGPATALASLKVDGFELLPSARLPLQAGLSEARLKPVKLVRPRQWWSKEASKKSSPYKMELSLFQGADGILDVQDLDVWAAQG